MGFDVKIIKDTGIILRNHVAILYDSVGDKRSVLKFLNTRDSLAKLPSAKT